jgi:hypothetical protein
MKSTSKSSENNCRRDCAGNIRLRSGFHSGGAGQVNRARRPSAGSASPTTKKRSNALMEAPITVMVGMEKVHLACKSECFAFVTCS